MSETCHRVCPQQELSTNSIQQFEVDGKTIALYNIEGAIYATDDTCTHGLSSLSKGELDGDVVECSLHFGAFHVPSGKPVGAPCSVALQTYRTEVRDGIVHIFRPA